MWVFAKKLGFEFVCDPTKEAVGETPTAAECEFLRMNQYLKDFGIEESPKNESARNESV